MSDNHDSAKWKCEIRVDKYDADIDNYVRTYGNRYGPRLFHEENEPIETIEREGNLLMTAGATALWNALTTGTAGTFTNANSAIGVGDGSGPGTIAVTNASTAVTGTSTTFTTTFTVGQTLLIAGVSYTVSSITSATALVLTATYAGSTASGLTYIPGTIASQTNLQAAVNAFRQAMVATFPSVSANQVQFQATFGGSSANFAWNEWAVFNSVGSGSPPTGGVMLNRAVPSGGLGVKAVSSTWTLTVTISLS